MSEIPASVQNITPQCRLNRGEMGALYEAWARIEGAYANYVHAPDNEQVIWRLSLIRIDAEWTPHLDYAGEQMEPGEFRDRPASAAQKDSPDV